MRCPFCGAKKGRRVWVCAERGSPIPKPKKPPYEAAGWEWIAAIAFSGLSLLVFAAGFVDTEFVGVVVSCFGVAFGFSAARDEEIYPRVVGILCLTAVTALFLGTALLYVPVILLVERARWRLRVARM